MRTAAAAACLLAACGTVLAACSATPHPVSAAAGTSAISRPPAGAAPVAPGSGTGGSGTGGSGTAAPRPRAAAPVAGPRGSAPNPSTAAPSAAAPGRGSTTGGPSARPRRRAVSSSAPPAEALACPLGALRIQALRGGASLGQEFALLTFTNDAATPCRVSGYPTVSLRHRGSALGSAHAAPTPGSGSVTLNSGASAQVRMQVATDCAAPQSDHVRVTVPAADGFVALPLELRGCSLQVGAFQPAA